MATAVPYVAVVDDELPVRTALGRLLRLADYDVAIYASGEVFLAAVDARPDCAVLDIHMPGLPYAAPFFGFSSWGRDTSRASTTAG
jgi:FixJ family two-component response regulator